MTPTLRSALVLALLVVALGSCDATSPGLAPATPAATTVKFDFFHLPLPDIPLPNDLATRVDTTSATGLRVNASMIAPTAMETSIRRHIDQLDGWGVLQPIAIPFSGPLDVQSILAGHRDADYDTSNDVIYLVNVDPRSPELGRVHHLDVGQGNYPVVLRDRTAYGKNDPRAHTLSLLYEETDEDVNGNGVLDPGEDTDADGVLDVPNYLPGANPDPDDLAARADALMTFYERQTNTLLATPLVPLRERTRYAVVVTRRLLDQSGQPVGSPFPWINHPAQTESLRPLASVLAPLGVGLSDVAFAFTYTTQTTDSDLVAVRDGLYGHGVQRHLGERYPAKVRELLPLRDRSSFPGATKLHLMYGENWAQALAAISEDFLERDPNSVEQTIIGDGQRYVDYIVIGSYDSPQLFPRAAADGTPLPYNEQSWPADLDRKAAPDRSEKVYFTLAVPRPEVSARGQGKPAPLAILLHGHTGNRFDALTWSSYLCKYGLAVLSIDGPSHGLSLSQIEELLATGVLGKEGLAAAAAAIFTDRAVDLNADEKPDSGADFWTSYLFHTRDMVRQFLLDLMQAVRIVRGFDGTRTWELEPDADGQVPLQGLAGDFDGDGVIDVGGDAPITVTGGSLGGMMAMLLGSLEPEVTATAPIVGGGALATIGIRSTNSGAKVGFMIRAMAPAYVGTRDADSGAMLLETFVPDLIRDVTLPLATVTGVGAGDTMVVENLRSGERGCGLVDPDGRVRASVASNAGDKTRFVFYQGPVIVPGGECEVAVGATEIAMVDTLDRDVDFQGVRYDAGTPIVALTEGLGLLRGDPDFRRMQGTAQLALDRGDPGVYAGHLQREPLTYPGTGQQTGAHYLMIFTAGDTSVPNSAGMVVARSAGALSYLEPDPRYGMPPNQVLIDHHIAEGVSSIPRYRDSNGRGVLMDMESFSGGDDVWTAIDLPRLDPPLNLGLGKTDLLGGSSAAFFVMTNPTGKHGFDGPGAMIDDVRKACAEACTETGDDPCGCSTKSTYDVGLFLINMIGRYLATNGMDIRTDLCQSQNTCTDDPPLPAVRPAEELD